MTKIRAVPGNAVPYSITEDGRVVIINSEVALEYFLNNANLPPKFQLLTKGAYYVIASADPSDPAIRSPEAQDVLDRLGPLSDAEANAISQFVDNEVGFGNWGTAINNYTDSKYDTFWFFGFQGIANALTQLHPALPPSSAVPVNAPTFTPGVGFTFDGVNQHLDSNYNPSVNGVNYQLDDAQIGVFITRQNKNTNGDWFGALDGSDNARLRDQRSVPNIIGRINSQAAENFVVPPTNDNSLIIASRTASNISNLFINGTDAAQLASPSVSIPNLNLFIAALNNGGAPSAFKECQISTAITGASINFNHEAHYQNIIDLLIALDVFAGPILARYSNLTLNEENALRTFINKEALDGNLGNYDEFFPFFLSDPADSLIGFFDKTATNNGGTHLPGAGYDFGELDFIDTNFNPTNDGQNYQLNNAMVGIYLQQYRGGRYGAGSAVDATGRTYFDVDANVVSTINSSVLGITGTPVNSRVLVTDNRLDANTQRIYINGENVSGDLDTPSQALPNANLYIGAVNGFASDGVEGVYSSAIIGASVNFNQRKHYENFLDLLKELDLLIQPVIDRFPNPLAPGEEVAIRSFLEKEIENGNFLLYDEFYFFGLADTQNALTGWISKTATNNGGTKKAQGFEFDQSVLQYIDTDFNPEQDGQNYQTDNALMGAYLWNAGLLPGTFATAFGARDLVGGTKDVLLVDDDDFNRVSAPINSVQALLVSDRSLGSGEYSIITRVPQSNFVRYYVNGQFITDDTIAPVGRPNQNVFLGARNDSGAAQTGWKGLMSSWIAAAGEGFNVAEHYDNLFQLFEDLDLFAGPVIARYSNLTPTEETALRKYINAEALAGNHFLKDEEYFLFLTDAGDSLTGAFNKTATNNGATHNPGVGYDFDGVDDYIDSNFNPSVDGVNYQLDDALAGAFVKQNNDSASNKFLFAADSVLELQQQPSNDSLRQRMNSANRFENGEPFFTNDSLYISIRQDSLVLRIYKNGVLLPSGANSATSTVPNQNIVIGADNAFGTNFDGTISSFLVGGHVGFNHEAHYNNLQTLLIEVGVLP